MKRRPPRSTRTDTLFPYTTLFRSTIRATRGVILGSGGFEHNQQLRARYLPQPTQAHWSAASPGNTGDLLMAAQAVSRTCWIAPPITRSEEHTSELQSLMRISYAVFCLKKKNNTNHSASIIAQ